MKKFFAILLAFILVLSLAACHEESGVLDEIKTYEIASHVHSLDIEINAANFTIVYADRFKIESNLKNLSVSENGGVLKIVDKIKSNVTYTDAMLTLHLPRDITFDDVNIKTGAANLTADSLSTNSLTLKLGAGNAEFGCLNAYRYAEIEGGAGQITVHDGILQNLSLEWGVGRLDLTAALSGESDLVLGVGESNITLIGSPDDYTLDVDEGIGSITIDRDFGSDHGGNGQNQVEIEGGIGNANISFRAK